MEVTVKWFNPDKGFGFVAPLHGTEDIFLHFSALQKIGKDQVNEGDTLICEVGPGKKGRQVVRVAEIRPGTGIPSSSDREDDRDQSGHPLRRRTRRAPNPLSDKVEELVGSVKWFNPHKGFGFASPEEGGADVFIHASLLHPTGLKTLETGQRIRMQVSDSPRGREAVELELVD
jgi:CspA family cold shock protein